MISIEVSLREVIENHMKDFIEELRWRGMLHDSTPGIEEHLKTGSVRGYIGFDPTAASLTIGNYVQVMLLKLFQDAGHRPVVLMGGATGLIGDPSGKNAERQLKSKEEIQKNLEGQAAQLSKFLDFNETDGATLANNHDFYKDMNVLEFLRDVGKNLTVNYMMSKDSVKNRLESGLSFTEFSYQLIQGYDFVCLNIKYDCTIQMGGSDQWGNITSGTELLRRIDNQKGYAVTTPLLTKSDGQKFGKSEKGNLWLDPEMTSPYAFYQFWVNAADADMEKFLKYFSLRPKDEILNLVNLISEDPQKVKSEFAEEMTKRIHGDDAFNSVQNVSRLLFDRKMNSESLSDIPALDLKAVGKEIPSFSIPRELLGNSDTIMSIIDLMSQHTSISSSKGEARRAVQNNAVSINKTKVANVDATLSGDQALHGQYFLLENGKKNKFLIELT